MNDCFVIRPAVRADAATIFGFIQGIAEYEKMRNELKGTAAEVERTLFDEHQAEALLAEENGFSVGFALYFFNYSTFQTKHGLWLEDIFILPEHRGKGYGKALLLELVRVARNRGCGRMEWTCLDWNTPSIAFYKSLGARPMSEWTTYRLDGDDLARLSPGKPGKE